TVRAIARLCSSSSFSALRRTLSNHQASASLNHLLKDSFARSSRGTYASSSTTSKSASSSRSNEFSIKAVALVKDQRKGSLAATRTSQRFNCEPRFGSPLNGSATEL